MDPNQQGIAPSSRKFCSRKHLFYSSRIVTKALISPKHNGKKDEKQEKAASPKFWVIVGCGAGVFPRQRYYESRRAWRHGQGSGPIFSSNAEILASIAVPRIQAVEAYHAVFASNSEPNRSVHRTLDQENDLEFCLLAFHQSKMASRFKVHRTGLGRPILEALPDSIFMPYVQTFWTPSLNADDPACHNAI